MTTEPHSPLPDAPRETGYQICTLQEARDLARVIAAEHPDPDRVVIGLTELLVNAVEHGNLGITYREKADLVERGELEREIARRLALPELASRRVKVTFCREPDRLATWIEDEGEGFDWKLYLAYDPKCALDLNGHGIAIARGMSFDDVLYQGRGNVVVAVIRLGDAPAAAPSTAH